MKRINAVHSVIMSNEDSIFNYFGWPSVTILPDGTLACVASGFRLGHVCPFGKSCISYSRDNGRTWTKPAPVIDTLLDDRDSGITCSGGNRVIITSFNNTAMAQRGYAGEDKETDSELAKKRRAFIYAYLDLLDETKLQEKYYGSTYVISEDGGYTFGEVKRAPISNIHGPSVSPSGEVIYIGRAFEREPDRVECWKMKEDDSFEFVSAIENVSDEHGSLLSCEPCSVILPDGKILVHIRVQRGGKGVKKVFTTYQCQSTDGGKTFTKPYDLKNEGAPCHLLRHSSGVLIGTYGYRNPPFGQRVMLSRDNGNTWDMDYILRDDGETGDLGYPCTTELPDGRLLSVYYQAEPGNSHTVIMQSIWELPKE